MNTKGGGLSASQRRAFTTPPCETKQHAQPPDVVRDDLKWQRAQSSRSAAAVPPAMPVGVVLDNGGGLIKAGLVPLHRGRPSKSSPSPSVPTPLVVPNALARPAKNALPPPTERLGKSRRPSGSLVAGEILLAPDVTGMALRRPVDRGAVAAWDAQRDVWASVFSADLGIGLEEAADAKLVVTEQLGIPTHMRRAMDEMVFEEFGFAEYAPVTSQRLAAAGVGRRSCVVVDSGFSATTAVPVVGGCEVGRCARRLALGGKALTNALKETVSFRSVNLMDEGVVVEAVKERLCYVSLDYYGELAECKRERNGIRREYVLPDLSRGGGDRLGHVMSEDEERDGTEQILPMNNERISVPEILFNPSDVGLQQAGVAEIIFQAVQACPEKLHADLYANVVLTGGNCRFLNFRERVVRELRPLVSDNFDLNVYMDEDPVLTTFNGGVSAMKDDSVPLRFVSKKFYEESGSDGILRMLYGGFS